MLSSTVVTVLAPPWSGRLRRTKRFEGSNTSEAQGNLQDVANTTHNRAQQYFQETQNQHLVERVLTDRSQDQLRGPFLGTRSNTVGWSSSSGPASLDYECRRKMIQTISLDVNSGRLDNKDINAGALSPLDTTASPLSPLPLNPNEQRRTPQTVHQGALSALSSKPTTSSMLLSLRRFNSNSRSSNAASSLSNPFSLSSLPGDRDRKLSTTHLSQTFLNKSEQEKSKPLLSPSSISYRTTETGPVLSPLSSSHRERNISEKCLFSSLPISKDTEDTLVTQQSQTISRSQSSFTCSKHSFQSRGPSERQDTNTNLFSENSVSSPTHSLYDHSALVKPPFFPRRTTLTSKSWWKEVTQEGSSPLTTSDTTNIKDKQNTPTVQPCNDYSYLASPCPTDNRSFSSQTSNNTDNNNTTETVCKGNMNFAMKTQGGTHNVKQRNTEELPDHESGWLVKQQYASNLNNREPQEPYSLPSTLSCSKISTTTAQTTLSHPKDLTKHDESNSSFTENVPPTLLNTMSSNTPTESSSTFNNNHCSSRSNSIPTSPHNKESERFTKQPFSHATTMTVSSQALTSKTTSALPPSPNTKTSSSFHSHPVSSQTNMHTSSHTSSSFQTPKFTNTANTTPLGFERSYASLPKPFHPKTVSSLIPRISGFSKTNSTPVSTASISSYTTGSHPAPTTVPSLYLTSPPVTSAITSSPTTVTISSLLTPPATPVITSHNYLEISSPNEGTTRSRSPERDPKKLWVEGKRVRRVTWEDSVDLQHSESITVEKPDPSQVPTNPLSPSRSPRSVSTPSIFSFLRSNTPTKSTPPLCSPTPKTSSIQVGNGGKFRSLSSDSADLKSREQVRTKHRPSDTLIFDQGRQDLTTPRQERTQSVETDTVQCPSSAPLSLPPDFSSGYKLRYSSPPYSSLMSSRSTQGETKTRTLRSPLFKQTSQSVYTPHPSLNTHPTEVKTLPTSKSPMFPISPPQPLSLPFQNKTAMQDNSKLGLSQTDQVNSNHSKNSSHSHQNGQVLLVDNRVQVSSQSLQGDNTHNSSSACVTETLVYSIKSKVGTTTPAPVNTSPTHLQHTANTTVSVETNLSQQPHTVQIKEEAGKTHNHSDQSSSGSSSTESQLLDEEGCSKKMKASVLGKSRFSSVESPKEQSPKRSRFALKKSVSTPNSSLSRSDSLRTNKSNNKMDQVLNRLRQTFSNKRSDDDLSFPWKWKRASQTPSVSGSSDVSSVSDNTVGSTKTLEDQDQDRGMVLKDKGTEGTSRWTTNKYTIIPLSADRRPVAGDQFSIWSDESTQETDQDEQNACAELKSDSKPQVHLTVHSPTMHQFDFYKDSRTDNKPTNQFLFCRDIPPGRSPNPSGGYPTQSRKSTSSPRSPFSPFSSLSPLSPFSSPDVTDDSVFYSPKLQRRRESPSPCEPGEGISLGGSRRSRASTGPPSAGPGQDNLRLASSYADLKYGIEPGKSFSVSSVLSSRLSRPGRISTGSRFMSVGDLSESALTCGSTSKDLDQWSFTPSWTTEHDCRPTIKCKEPYFPSDPGKMRSRSLPRSLTLANWSSGVSISHPVTTKTSTPACHWSPNMNTCHFAWDAEGPPTPPPTPPLSPVSRRMSKPSSLSSPTFPSSPGSPQPVDSQSSRGHLPSRGYVSSLSTFEESSDSSSDTTTDDEYYLEAGEDEEKETEL